jgi:hypothetical protein
VIEAVPLVKNYFGNLIYFCLQANAYSAVVENLENFQINADVHKLNTSRYDHMPNANLNIREEYAIQVSS